jgi:hypothetical protein
LLPSKNKSRNAATRPGPGESSAQNDTPGDRSSNRQSQSQYLFGPDPVLPVGVLAKIPAGEICAFPRPPELGNGSGRLSLAENEVWQVKDSYVEIVTIGKRLVHYKVAKTFNGRAAKAVPIRVGTIEELERYLKINRARRISSKR